tara:strand:+ start:8372 stop:9388 length:1017 start_codon:yes stop_codon:yes gene_type:complete
VNPNRPTIIAEAGVNHNGSIKIAKKMIDIAAKAGADYVKFQTFKANLLVTKNALKANYQKRLSDNKNESQFNMLHKLELSYQDHVNLIKHSKKRRIKFLSTPFDNESVELLSKLRMKIFKIPSGEITNLPYLRKIGSLGKPIILSTGMSELDEVKNALNIILKAGSRLGDIIVMHCNTDYPTRMQDVNLKAMLTLRDQLGVSVGYSDHTLGIEVPIAAAAMGAKVIEKHFTLDRSMKGPDHAASIDPVGLKNMIGSIRNVSMALGSGIKAPTKSELENITTVRKSILAKVEIKKGQIFSEKNLTVKRPADGLSPMEWDNLIGKISNRTYKVDEPIDKQ